MKTGINFRATFMALYVAQSLAFVTNRRSAPAKVNQRMFASSADVQEGVLALNLDKPLGMILEEVEEGQPKGVFVLELAEEGSAAQSEFKDELVGLKVATVMGADVTNLAFDEVMEKLIDAPSPVSIELTSGESEEGVKPEFEVGTAVKIAVLEDGKETVLDAKVGDNLRKLLLENNIEVYKGLKQKLGKYMFFVRNCVIYFGFPKHSNPVFPFFFRKLWRWGPMHILCR